MDQRVEKLLDDLRFRDAEQYALVEAVRSLALGLDPGMTEKVMYGGILFGVEGHFCGVFAYKQHVSVEFSAGATLPDEHRVLEGKGKQRRHIKLTGADTIEEKHLAAYLRLAFEQASAS